MIIEFVDFLKYLDKQHLDFIRDQVNDGEHDFLEPGNVHKDFATAYFLIGTFCEKYGLRYEDMIFDQKGKKITPDEYYNIIESLLTPEKEKALETLKDFAEVGYDMSKLHDEEEPH